MRKIMGRPPCCDKSNVKRGLWTEEEDLKLIAYTNTHGVGNWTAVPKKAGLKRCGKSCRLRWTNYLRPNLKHDSFTPQEEEMIINLHATIGSRWSVIANYLPGRTDNDIKNHWNTKLSKKLYQQGIDPVTHKPVSEIMEHISCLTTTQNQYQTAPESCITNLNRDLNNVFLAKPGPVLNPGFYEASSRVEVMPFTFTNGGMSVSVEGSASSTTPTTYPIHHQEVAIQQSHDLKWSDFLVDDVFLSCIQDDNASNIDQFSTNSKGKVNQNSKENPEFDDTILEEEVNSLFQAQASSSSSFIDSILDQGTTMMEFSELLNDHDGLI